MDDNAIKERLRVDAIKERLREFTTPPRHSPVYLKFMELNIQAANQRIVDLLLLMDMMLSSRRRDNKRG